MPAGRPPGLSGRWRGALLVGALLGVLIFALPVSAREKTDEIWLKNGSLVIGEIKSLETGVMTVKTDDMGTLSIEWVAVASLKTDQYFTVRMTDGTVLTGRFVPVGEDGKALVEGVMGKDEIDLLNVSTILELERTFWTRWSGYIDLGATFASANNQQDLTFDSQAVYTTSRFRWSNALNASYSDREDASQTSRESLTSSYQRYVGKRQFWAGSVEFMRNEELDLDLRTVLGGAYGWFAVQTPRAALGLGAGMAVNKERYTGEEGEWNVEALLIGTYSLYLFEGRETTLYSTLQIFPSFTHSGRYRLEFSLSLRRKMVHNLTFSIGIDESYDSSPPREESKQSDLRLNTTIGWTF